MDSQTINKKALELLSKQEWRKAQNLFFYNAKSNPCHETLNNLGYYLITEGLLCRNGKTINALNRGIKYLIEASTYKTTDINCCAIVKAISYRLLTDSEIEKVNICEYACDLLRKALLIRFSEQIQYNLLCFEYMLDRKDKNLLLKVENLVKKFVCSESVSLYLEVLSVNNFQQRGLWCIEKYGEHLSEIEQLMFYTKFGLFESGYKLCKLVFQEYDIDEFIASAIIECCLATGHLWELDKYKNQIRNAVDIKRYSKREDWRNKICEDSKEAELFRKYKINNYHLRPSLIDLCCYFGCAVHNIGWDSN